MNKQEAVSEWRETELSAIRQQYEADKVPGYIARTESWNNWIDYMIRSGRLPERADGWTRPRECVAPWDR